MEPLNLRQIAYNSLLELSNPEGINASSKEGVFGCIFGRDSAITCLKIIRTLETHPEIPTLDMSKLSNIVRNSLLNIMTLQGKEINIESGEQPGKFIHEYRKDNYERLINRPKPWYVYKDGKIRNYDSIDSTPLMLIALFKYWQLTKDNAFLMQILDSVEMGLEWIINFSDVDNDNLSEYELSATRAYGGLQVQSWTDSVQSLMQKGGNFPPYPIAPVEVQGYMWLALKLWGDFYTSNLLEKPTKSYGLKLLKKAKQIKFSFNNTFMFEDGLSIFPAQALDGEKNQIRTITANPLLLLWACYENDGKTECILNKEFVQPLVARSFKDDLFDKDAGLRTMSTFSPTYNANADSYHNGSFWPKLNGMIYEGLYKFGYEKEAIMLKEAAIKPLAYFKTPIELYIKDLQGQYFPYRSSYGQGSCMVQAWSAAAMLDLLKDEQ